MRVFLSVLLSVLAVPQSVVPRNLLVDPAEALQFVETDKGRR